MPIHQHRSLRRLVAHAAVCMLVPAVGGAQQLHDLSAGARVRVHAHGSATAVTGTLATTPRDTIRIVPTAGRDTLALALESVRELYVSQGHGERRVGRNALRGLAAGAVVGGVFGAMVASADPEDADFFGGVAGATAFFAALGAAPGLVIGAATGLARREIWARVPIR